MNDTLVWILQLILYVAVVILGVTAAWRISKKDGVDVGKKILAWTLAIIGIIPYIAYVELVPITMAFICMSA